MNAHQSLAAYFLEWMQLYKQGAVAPITYAKYENTWKSLRDMAHGIKLSSLTRQSYQALLNTYAESHERQTVMDFHHHVKAALLDAVEEGILKTDPTRKAVIKGTVTRVHKPKFLDQRELQALLYELDLDSNSSIDYLILLIAKTGLRFAEALGLTPADFDFQKQTVSVSKTWNYKSKEGGFAPTKNPSSMRTVQIDWQLCMQMRHYTQGLSPNQLIFVRSSRIHNATINDRLARLCSNAGVPIISIHGLRHTHASLLLYAGVSSASVAKRLGHANMTTTQSTYLHIIRELEHKDADKVMQFLSTL